MVLMDKKLNITTQSDKEGSLVILEGKAPDIRMFEPASYSGTITAPADWMELKVKAGFKLNASDSTIEVDKHQGIIKAFFNEFIEKEKHKITGKLLPNPDLEKFNINTQRTWTNKELKQFLKMNRFFFEDPDENRTVVSAMEKFKVKLTSEFEDTDDLKGNKKRVFEQTVQSELVFSFKLYLPIFKGEEPTSIRVDINFDISDKSAVFWLESADLKELEASQRESIIDREVDRFEGYPVIFV